MAKSFEDMHWQEWPSELIELHAAAQAAWEAYAALDEILSNRPRTVLNHDVTRSTLIELAGRAYALLRDLRAEGMRQLAAWEESQKSNAPQDQYFTCLRCAYDAVTHGVFVARDGVTVANDATPPCPYCGESDAVGLKTEEEEAEGMRQLAAWEESQAEEESQDTEAEREAWEEAESRRKQIANWNAVADGLQPPYPSEY